MLYSMTHAQRTKAPEEEDEEKRRESIIGDPASLGSICSFDRVQSIIIIEI